MTSYSLAEDSPLRRLPRDLNPDQVCFLDGMRYSIDMAYLAYVRLCMTLGRIAVAEGGEIRSLDQTSAFLDAWSVVDTMHRLRQLAQQMPRMKQKATALRAFLLTTEPAEELRNIVQHLRNEAHEMAENGFPVFGTIAWVSTVPLKELTYRTCVLVSGSVQTGSALFVNPLGKQVRGDVDLVALRCKSAELSLTNSVDAVARFTTGLERSLAPQFQDLPTRGADLFVAVEVEATKDA